MSSTRICLLAISFALMGLPAVAEKSASKALPGDVPVALPGQSQAVVLDNAATHNVTRPEGSSTTASILRDAAAAGLPTTLDKKKCRRDDDDDDDDGRDKPSKKKKKCPPNSGDH